MVSKGPQKTRGSGEAAERAASQIPQVELRAGVTKLLDLLSEEVILDGVLWDCFTFDKPAAFGKVLSIEYKVWGEMGS